MSRLPAAFAALPIRPPKHRAPKHRRDVPVDSCSFGDPTKPAPCRTCEMFPGGVHRAALDAVEAS